MAEEIKKEEDVRYTRSGIPVKAFYTPEDIEDIEYDRDLNDPGVYPFTRGPYPRGYRQMGWITRPISGYGLAEESRERQDFLLKHGQESHGRPAMNIIPDVPTFYGFDSDDPRARYDVGRLGIITNTIEDLKILVEGIPLDQLDMGFVNTNTAAHQMAMYVGLADEAGVPRSKLKGVTVMDNLCEYISSGCPIWPVKGSYRLSLEVIKFCVDQMPMWSPVNVQGYNITNGGGHCVQEIAFALSAGIQLVRGGIEMGLDVDQFAGKISFNFGFYNYFFEEIAKLRAARRLWARILRDKFGAKNPKTMQMKVSIHDSAQTLVAQDPLNNLARITIHMLGAFLGYTQAMICNSYDEAITIPTEEAIRRSLMANEIIKYETGVPDVSDPLGGSYYVEYLTNELEKRAEALIDKVEELGGMVRALEIGFPQRELAEFALKERREIESGEKVIIGLNKYQPDKPPEAEVFECNPEAARIAIERLQEVRAKRDNARVKETLEELRRQTEDPKGYVMPALIEAAKARATLGEMSQVFWDVFGENVSSKVIRIV